MLHRLLLPVVGVLLTADVAAAQQKCESLAGRTIGKATITSAVALAAGPYTPALAIPPATQTARVETRVQAAAQPLAQPQAPANRLPAYCDVRGTIRPTPVSEIKFAVWLPQSGWNGKYRQEGNGGWAGNIPYQAMIDPLIRGYVTAGTDNGHEGGGAMWAIGQPEKLIDFGYRAVHELSVHAKTITNEFYGKQPSRSYFVGCSDGGREGLMEAQRFPDDFDGMIVGAPANRWSRLFTAFVWNELAQLETPLSRLSPEKLPAIERAVLTACDKHDTVQDGLLEDPRSCKFDPAVLACSGVENDSCLTAPQLTALRKIYEGPKNPRTGEQIYPGLPAGTESATWRNWVAHAEPLRSTQAVLGIPYYGQAVFEDPKWNILTMDFDKDFAYGEEKAAPVLNSASRDLRSYRARNGKIIQYHGWGDPAISAYASIEYYDAVRGFLSKYPDARSQSAGQIEDFYRLFLIPGMAHCAGGVGPHAFGTRGAVSPETMNDPRRDIFAALEQWVEQGTAPEQFTGSGTSGSVPRTPLTRPICLYPQVAHYKGTGDIYDAVSFSCVAPQAPR